MEKDTALDIVRRMKPTDHIIMFYEQPEDKHRVLFTYLKAGLDSQEAVAYVTGLDETPNQIKTLMEKHGVNASELEKKGTLQIMSYKDWYITSNEFNKQEIINRWTNLLNKKLAEGFKGLRVMGDVTCFFQCDMTQQLLDYENSLHKVLDIPLTGLCAYSLPVMTQKNHTQLIIDLINAHKNVIFIGPEAALVKE